MPRIAMLSAALMVAACGPDLVPLDENLNGSWGGVVVVKFDGLNPVAWDGSLVVATASDIARVANVCPDGSGYASISGSGRTAQWSGDLSCPPFAGGGCSAITLTLQQGTLSLQEDGKLSVTSSGSASGCGTTRGVTLAFTGSKK